MPTTGSWAATPACSRPRWRTSPGVAPGQRVLDVGCGPGALTAVLVDRVGADNVAAVDPSEPFVAAARGALPGRRRPRGRRPRTLPFADDALRRRARPARRPLHDGPGRRAPRDGARDAPGRRRRRVRLGPRRRARPARPVLGGRRASSTRPSSTNRDLAGRARGPPRPSCSRRPACATSRRRCVARDLRAPDFEEWWEPFTRGVGPAGAYVAGLDAAPRPSSGSAAAELLPERPVHVSSSRLGRPRARLGREPARATIANGYPDRATAAGSRTAWKRPGATACATPSTSSSRAARSR